MKPTISVHKISQPIKRQEHHGARYLNWVGSKMPYTHKSFFSPHSELIQNLDAAYFHTMKKVDGIINQFSNVKIDKNIATRIVYAGTSSMTENELETAKDKLMLHDLIHVFNDLNKKLKIEFKEICNKYIADNMEIDPELASRVWITERAVLQWAARGYQLHNGEEDLVNKITMSNIVKYNNHVGPNPHALMFKLSQDAQKKKEAGPQSVEEAAMASANRKRKLEQLLEDLERAPDDYVRVASEIETEARLLIDDFTKAIDSGTSYEWISDDIEAAHTALKTAYERVCQYDFLDALDYEKDNIKAILEMVEETMAEQSNDNSHDRFGP